VRPTPFGFCPLYRFSDLGEGSAGATQHSTAAGRGGIRDGHVSRWRAKSLEGKQPTRKDVKNEGRSGNVYENKGPCDIVPDTKGDISAWLHVILHRKTHILQEPSAYLPLFERWSTNRQLQVLHTFCGKRRSRDIYGGIGNAPRENSNPTAWC
jgi:hypothetical protein